MFIKKNDFNTVMYAELIDVISREEDAILDAAIAAAIQQAKGYLNRYDTDALFNAYGDDRDPLLLLWAKDIAAWHFIGLANANVDLELRKTRRDEAIRELEKIQGGKFLPDGWPEVAEEHPGDNAIIKVSSRPRRETNY